MELYVYRNRSVVATFKVGGETRLTQRFYGENFIQAEFESRDILDIAIGDYIVYNTIKYYVNTLPNVEKVASNQFRHSVTFEAEYYDFAKVQFMYDDSGEFDYVADLEGYIDLLVTNMNRVYGSGSWVKGTMGHTDATYRHLNFQAQNCRQVIQTLCKEFGCEIYFSRHDILTADKMGRATGLTLQYRYGLRGLTRTTQSDKNIVTRLYAFGSTKNLGTSYGAPRLHLPTTKNLVTNGGFETADMTGWSVWGSPESRWVNNTTPGGYEGTCSYYHKAGAGGTNCGSEQSFTVVPNTEYTISGWVRVISSAVSGGLRIMSYDGATYYAGNVNRNKLNVWQKVSATFTTGAAQTTATVWVGGDGEGYFDNIQFERGANATTFVNSTETYLEKNEGTYGVIEHTELFDEIYPHRDGTVTGIDGSDETIIYDTGIDFDVNSYLIDGVAPKVHFQSGALAGYAFEIYSYTHATNEFVLVPVKSENGDELPNSTIKPAVNDKYVIIDILMPAAYVTAAEETLFTLAEAYLDANADPRVSYDLTADPRYFKTNGILLNVGDELTINDDDLNISKTVRVVELHRKLIDQYDYMVKLSDGEDVSLYQRLYDDAAELKKAAAVDKAGDIVKARLNWRTNEELKNMVFDPDGYFTDAIRPISIETTKLAVGSKSGSFTLDGVEIKPNYGGNNNAIVITGGTLVHLAVDNADHDTIGVWTLNANTTYQSGGLTTGTAYYLYARCHKTDYSHANNAIVLDTSALSVDQDPYWYFLVGVLHSTSGSTARSISQMYGQTYINGKTITTGKIQSADGNTYFDLDGNTLVIGSASGYANISDKPTNLSGINSSEGSKLSGIASGATVGATWGVNLGSVPQRFSDTIPPTGTGLQITADHIGYYDTNKWKVYISSAGDLVLGDASGGSPGLWWDETNGILTIVGKVFTSNSGARLQIFPDSNTGLVVYDNAGAKVLEALVGGTDVGDVTIGDYASNKGLKYDKSAGSFTMKGVFHSSNGPSGGVVINDTNEIYVYNSTTPVFLVDYGISGVYTGISVRAVSANGGQFVAGNGADIINAPGDYAALCDGFIYVKRDDTDHDLLDLYYNSDSGTASLLKAQTGTTPVVVMELQSNGVLLLKNTMQLTSTSGGAVVAHTGSAWKTLSLGGSDLDFLISNVSKMTLSSSGNLSVSAGTINASGGFKDNGTAGIDGTCTVKVGGVDKTLTFSGGIITGLA